MQAQINTQIHFLAGFSTFENIRLPNHLTLAILDNPRLTGHTRQPAFQSQLDTFLTVIIDTGQAHQLRGHLPGRIVASVFQLTINTANAQIEDFLSLIGIQLPAEIEKLLSTVEPDFFRQFCCAHTKSLSQLWPVLLLIFQNLRVNPYRCDRCTDRKRTTIAIKNNTAMSRHHLLTYSPFVAFISEKCAILKMQITNTNTDRDKCQSHKRLHNTKASFIRGFVGIFFHCGICFHCGTT